MGELQSCSSIVSVWNHQWSLRDERNFDCGDYASRDLAIKEFMFIVGYGFGILIWIF